MTDKPETSHPFYSRFNQLITKKKEKGMGICAVAFYSGMNKNTLINYREKRSMPNVKQLEKLADYFGVTTDYLLGREDMK